MANPTPKNKSTRLQLPVGVAGTEPSVAPEGALAYATDTEVVRVKTSTGWEDVGGGGGGSITSIDSPDGSIDITNPGGPTVSVEVDPNAFVSTQFNVYGLDTTPALADRVVTNDSNDSYIMKYGTIGTIPVAGQANGTLAATKVTGITETSGPTALTVGAINDFQLLQRVGATVVGTAYPATTLVGDVNGPIIANEVNAIHETSGPTQLTIGAISSGQVLIRSGATVIGSTAGTPTGNPYIDPPVTAGALDDEFESGSSDMATRGWSIRNITDGANATRVGDVDPLQLTGSTLATNTYRSTLVGSTMLIEVPNDAKQYYFYKAFTPGTAGTVWARMQCRQAVSASTSATTDISSNGVFALGTSGGLPTAATNYVGTIFQPRKDGLNNSTVIYFGRKRAGVESLPSGTYEGAAYDMFGFKYANTPIARHFAASATGATFTDYGGAAVVGTNMPDTTNLAFAGFIVKGTSPNGAVNTLAAIDFFRTISGSGWIAQTPRPVAWNVVNADITNYSSKAVPVGADQVYIADSAASNAIKRSTIGSFVSSPGGASVFSSKPLVPDAMNDEFNEGSPDLAVRGWTVTNNVGVTMTRAGDVGYSIVPNAIPATQYRSTITPAGLLIQSPVEIWVHKAATGAAAFACEVRPSRATTANVFCSGPQVWDSATPVLNNTLKRALCEYFNNIRQHTYMTTNQVYSTSLTSSTDQALESAFGIMDLSAGSGTPTFTYNSVIPSRDYVFASTTSAVSSFTIQRAGFAAGHITAALGTWTLVRFFRRFTQNTWPPGL